MLVSLSGSAILTPSSGGEKFAVILDPQFMTQSFGNIGASLKDYMCAVLSVQSRQDFSVELTDRPLGECGAVREIVSAPCSSKYVVVESLRVRERHFDCRGLQLARSIAYPASCFPVFAWLFLQAWGLMGGCASVFSVCVCVCVCVCERERERERER